MSKAEAPPGDAPPASSRASSRFALLVGFAFALLFILASSVHLEGQGLFGDELHQATAVFAFGPQWPEIIDGLNIGGIPVLNMPYSGAIKSAMFAAWLQLPGTGFTAVSWRVFGILLSAAGIVAFCWIVGPRLRMRVLLTFLLLIVSDATLILGSRHDWGPIALALLLRLALLGVWIRGELQQPTPRSNSFLLGLLVGLSLFEKLSNVVLVATLPLLFGLSPGRRSLRQAASLAAGLGVGLLPLAAVNLFTWLTEGRLISLAPGMVRSFSTRLDFGTHLEEVLSLGAGEAVRKFILGSGAAPALVSAELLLVSALLIGVAIAALLWGRRNDLLRIAGVLLGCYGVIVVALYAISRPTWTHHWIIGTPFQYLAIATAALGLAQLSKRLATPAARVASGCFTLLLVGLLVTRALSFVSLEQSLLRGDAAVRWNPSLTRFGELMSEHVGEALVITAGWGLAPQVYCLSGGAPSFVDDLYWNYEREADITNQLAATGRRVLFVARPEWPSLVHAARGKRLWRDLDSIERWAPGWREVEPSDELQGLEWISVRRFERPR